MKRPEIVCLCGSTRFYEAFQRANFELTNKGKIVLSVGFYVHSSGQAHGESVGCSAELKKELDELHLRKIDLADRVLVLNVGGYIGESTAREIVYAIYVGGKGLDFLEPEAGERFLEDHSHRLGAVMADLHTKYGSVDAELARAELSLVRSGGAS